MDRISDFFNRAVVQKKLAFFVVIVISPAYSLNSMPSSGKHEKVMFFDSLDSRMKLFSETMMHGETAPEDSIFVMVGLL